jgi:hypothetical protein
MHQDFGEFWLMRLCLVPEGKGCFFVRASKFAPEAARDLSPLSVRGRLRLRMEN